MEGDVLILTEEQVCYIQDRRVLRMFVLEVSKRFTVGPPCHFDEGVIYAGPLTEIQRLKLFYEGMVFYHENRTW
jgi:hypothetical protein